MSFHLVCYLEQFAAVCESKFGRRYDLSDLERRLAVHRDGKHLFTAKDVARVFDPEATPFAKYWPRPHTKVLEEALAKERLRLAPLPANPADLVGRLLAIFHNLGTVSLILQFVYPERFAIFSTPVIYLVQVTRPALMDMYLAYCDELRVWCEHFHMPSVAATSTALWTYAEITKQVTDDPPASAPGGSSRRISGFSGDEPRRSSDPSFGAMAACNLHTFCWRRTLELLERLQQRSMNDC